MDFVKLKNLVKQNGDKFVFVENGEPEIVMMSFGEYEKLAKNNHGAFMRSSRPDIYPNEPHAFYESAVGTPETEFIRSAEIDSPGLPMRLEDIRLEDLPI